MARGVLANQAGRHQTLRGTGGMLPATDSDPSLDSASPLLYVRGYLGQLNPPCGRAYFLGLADQTGLVRLCLSLLLFVAVVLKSDGLSIEIAVGSPIGLGTWLLLVLILWELFLSIWLLSGIVQRRALTAALVTFGLFSIYSLGLLLAGASSCGCFGRWELHPAWTLSLDLTAISALLWLLRPPVPGLVDGTTESTHSHLASPAWTLRLRGLLCLVAWLSLSVLFLSVVLGRKGMALDQPGMTDLGRGVLLLEPEKWEGHPLPILESLDIRQDLDHGEWTVVLLRQSCPHCQAVLDTLLKSKSPLSQGGRFRRLAFIDFDGTLTAKDSAMANLGASRVGQVDARLHKALVELPVIFDVIDGVVHEVQLP
jgi:hypothetical protein